MHNYSILNELNIDPNNVKSVEELMEGNEHLVFITLNQIRQDVLIATAKRN